MFVLLQKSTLDIHNLNVPTSITCTSEKVDSPKCQQNIKSVPEPNNNVTITLALDQPISASSISPPPSSSSKTTNIPPISITQSQCSSTSLDSDDDPDLDSPEKEKLLPTQTSQDVPTIKEEMLDNSEKVSEKDNNTSSVNRKNHNKLSLTLPVDQSMDGDQSTAPRNPNRPHMVERTFSDRRKLSVQGLMGFAERRRSSGSIFSEMRKMSITNFDSLKSPGIGKFYLT